MWIGMFLAALAVLACAVLIWRDKARSPMPAVSAPTARWPQDRVGFRPALVSGVALVVLATVTISPKYGALAAIVALAVVVLRRPRVAGAAALVLTAGLAVLILRRQIRYRLVANPSWPAAFDDLHRLGLLVVVLLVVSTFADECPTEESEEVA
jgi:hypothetical protein